MTTLPQQNTYNQYVGDGVTAAFNYTFQVLRADSLVNDIAVYVTPPGQTADPAGDIRLLTTQYTVSGVGVLTGGVVTFTGGNIPVSGSVVTLKRNMSVSINVNFADARNFNGGNLDAAFERITLIMQQLNSDFQLRALQYIVDSYLPTAYSNLMPLLTNIDNQVWKSQGGVVIASVLEEDPDSSTLRADLANNTAMGNGAGIVGYYDIVNLSPTTVKAYLDYLTGEFGAYNIGYRDPLIGDVISVADYLNRVSDDNSVWGDNGSTNAIHITIPFDAAYQDDPTYLVYVGHTSTGDVTFQVNAFAPVPAYKVSRDGTTVVRLTAGDITIGGVYHFAFLAGVNYVICLNPNPAPLIRTFAGASIYKNTDQVITTGVEAAVTFPVLDYAKNVIVSGGSLAPQVTGYYQASAFVTASGGGVGSAALRLYLNGVYYQDLGWNDISGAVAYDGSVILPMTAGVDAVSLTFINSSGNTVTLNGSAQDAYFQLTYMGS